MTPAFSNDAPPKGNFSSLSFLFVLVKTNPVEPRLQNGWGSFQGLDWVWVSHCGHGLLGIWHLAFGILAFLAHGPS